MDENEQLIASISNNLEFTKTTIETIYNSLQITKTNLDQRERNAVESVGLIRKSAKAEITLSLICFFIVALVVIVVLRMLGII